MVNTTWNKLLYCLQLFIVLTLPRQAAYASRVSKMEATFKVAFRYVLYYRTLLSVLVLYEEHFLVELTDHFYLLWLCMYWLQCLQNERIGSAIASCIPGFSTTTTTILNGLLLIQQSCVILISTGLYGFMVYKCINNWDVVWLWVRLWIICAQ